MVKMQFSSGHYAAAFQDFLRGRGIPCVAIDESRRSAMAGARIDRPRERFTLRDGP